MPAQADKPIKFKAVKWTEHRENADALAAERGLSTISMADYLNEAAKFFEENRPRPESN